MNHPRKGEKVAKNPKCEETKDSESDYKEKATINPFKSATLYPLKSPIT